MGRSKKDREVMALIRRAAANLTKDVCATPGAIYHISYSGNTVSCSVVLPENFQLGIALDRFPDWGDDWDDGIHGMMANAVADIMRDCRSFPEMRPPAPNETEGEGNE